MSVAIVGPGANADPNSPKVREGQQFTLHEGDELAQWFDAYVVVCSHRLGPKERQRAAQAAAQTDAPSADAGEQGTGDDAAPTDAQAPMDEEN